MMLTLTLPDGARQLFIKAQVKGASEHMGDLFGDLIEQERPHQGYTDKQGRYHAPHLQRHKVRLSEQGRALAAKPVIPSAKNSGEFVQAPDGSAQTAPPGEGTPFPVAADPAGATTADARESKGEAGRAKSADTGAIGGEGDTARLASSPKPSVAQLKDGATKTKNGVTYVLRDGRWHRQAQEAASATEPAGFKIPPPQDDLDPSSPSYRYRDTGYVAGSRKEAAANLLRTAKRTGDRVRGTAIDWEELEQNPREAKEVITKSHLFGSVDWNALKANGMEPGAGFLADRVYASVGTGPRNDTPEGRQDYALALESLRDRLESCKTPAEITTLLAEIRQEHEGILLTADEARQILALKARHKEALAPQRAYDKELQDYAARRADAQSVLETLQYGTPRKRGFQRTEQYLLDLSQAKAKVVEADEAWQAFAQAHPQFQGKRRDLAGGWTAYESDVEWQARQYRDQSQAIRTRAVERARNTPHSLYRQWNQLGDRFLAVVGYNRPKGSEAFGAHVATALVGKIRDWSWAEKDAKPVAKGATEENVRFQLQVADHYERKGGRVVPAASTDALKQAFNLREVQSGNWVLRDVNAAKFHTEQTAMALADLADLIGAEDRQVSMNGRLALAFGARGTGAAGFGGAARAHYEPVHRIINLTKMGGGGALAHEWFHAFDNLLAEHFGQAAGTTDFLSADPSKLPVGPVRDAFLNLQHAMTSGSVYGVHRVPYTPEDVRTARFNIDQAHEYGMSAPAKLIKQAGNVHAATQAVDTYFDGVVAKLPATGNYRKKPEANRKRWRTLAAAYYGAVPVGGVMDVEAGQSMSSFRMEALRLDNGQAGKYWSSTQELAARAFQAWTEDRMAAKGQRNDYLSALADNKHYRATGQKPFPEGDERVRMNAAFDRLFASVAEDHTLAKALGNLADLRVLFFKALLQGAPAQAYGGP